MKLNFSTLVSLITLVFSITLFSCGSNPLDIDVSNVKVELKLKRFDQDLFLKKKDLTPTEIESLKNNYPQFFQDFTNNIINIGNIESPEAQHHLNAFTKDQYIKEIKEKTDLTFGDFSSYQKELKNAFKHYKHYFPNKEIPTVITYISGYNYAIVTDNTYLGIGLDMFLGSKHEAYDRLGLPQYKTNFMSKENLVTGAMLGWVSTEFNQPESNANLLTEMVHQGKILYLLDALMPKTAKPIKISYTTEQFNWCKTNETQVWFYIIDNELLYSKKTSDVIKFMGESPFIQGFPEGSPGRVGHWVGWQIVSAYMKQNPDITIAQLMQESNAQKILNKSKYKP